MRTAQVKGEDMLSAADLGVYQVPESAGNAEAAPQFRIQEGCVVFQHSAYDEDEQEIGRVRRALELSRSVGWERAVEEAYVPGTSAYRYVMESGRANFLGLLPLTKESVVLEIGCSMGQHTPPLAKACGQLYGLDVILEQAIFTRQRCVQQGLENVSVACGGEDCILPYRSGVFDAVVINLVLEWCGARASEPHEAAQLRLLTEAWRVMKPGGCLFLNTKNRYSLSLLFGGRDTHTSRLRFGSALPRPVLKMLLRWKGVKRTPGWLHSHRALGHMVRQAGFSSHRSYWGAPEMRYPRHYIPTDAASVRAARRSIGRDSGTGRVQRAVLSVLPAAAVKYVTPGLCLVATK